MQSSNPWRLLAAATFLLAACSDDTAPAPLAPEAPPSSALSRVAFSDDFNLFDRSRWLPQEHPLGRGSFYTTNVRPEAGAVNLVLPAGGYDGGEIRSADAYRYGAYEARLRVPDVPGSISAFFLYEGTARSDEIDIEIFNDRTRRIMFTVWVDGREVHNATMALPFDPVADHHTYRIEWSSSSVSFLVDGVMMQRWTTRLPRDPMYVMANSWWPTWLSGPVPEADRWLSIDRIVVAPR